MDKQPDSSRKVFSLSHLAIITVTGEDSAKFLQGQLTCDINSLSESQAGIAAFCNAKGRAISTLLIVKTAAAFLLILPNGLLDKVLNKLRMYILRSAVQLSGQSGERLFGLPCPPSATDFNLPAESHIVIKLPPPLSRYLCIAGQPESTTLNQQFSLSIGETEEWRYWDISSGFPWFEASQSELYIPQMLNIDKLGGVSFSKGCYTGQEIIARTHYLGKAKRSLFLAECDSLMETPDSGISILDSETRQSVGSVLNAQTFSKNTRLLVVLQSEDAEAKNLILDDAKQTAIKIVPIQ